MQTASKDIEDFVRDKAYPCWREVVALDLENFVDTAPSGYVVLSVPQLERLTDSRSSINTV